MLGILTYARLSWGLTPFGSSRRFVCIHSLFGSSAFEHLGPSLFQSLACIVWAFLRTIGSTTYGLTLYGATAYSPTICSPVLFEPSLFGPLADNSPTFGSFTLSILFSVGQRTAGYRNTTEL